MKNTDEKLERDLKLLCEKTQIPAINLQEMKTVRTKKGKAKKRIFLIAAVFAIFLIGSLAVNAESVYSFFSKVFTFGYVDSGIEQLSSSDINSYTDVKVVASDIELEVTNAVSDTNSTIIQLKATGLHLSETSILEILPSDIELYDEYGEKYELDNIGSGSYLEGKTYDVDVCPVVFEGGPIKKCKMKLCVSKINGILGNWVLEFEIEPNTEVQHFISETNYKFENGTEMTVTNASFYLTRTVIEGRYDKYIDDNSSYVGDYSYYRKPSVVNTAILYVDGKEVEMIRYASDHETFYITFPPVDPNSKIELELQLDRILSEDGNVDHPDYDNIIRKQINLILQND